MGCRVGLHRVTTVVRRTDSRCCQFATQRATPKKNARHTFPAAWGLMRCSGREYSRPTMQNTTAERWCGSKGHRAQSRVGACARPDGRAACDADDNRPAVVPRCRCTRIPAVTRREYAEASKALCAPPTRTWPQVAPHPRRRAVVRSAAVTLRRASTAMTYSLNTDHHRSHHERLESYGADAVVPAQFDVACAT